MKKTALIGWAILVAILFGLAEIASYAVLTLTPQLKHYLYTPPAVTRAAYEDYLDQRHPTLGWPGKDWLAEKTDDRGARLSPSNDSLGDVASCVDVYGDSFAFSDEVSDEDAWANVLADRLGCRVDNYGIGGYGVGQALLRLEGNLDIRPPAETIILTLYPGNLVRNVNQWRYLLTRNPLTFKPAFYLGETGVEQAPLFDGDYDDFQQLIDDPAAFLPNEALLPGAPVFRAPVRMEFPYSGTVASLIYKLASSFRSFDTDGRSNFYNYPSYHATSEGPSEEMKTVMEHILNRFKVSCGAAERNCVFVLMPNPELLFQRGKFGEHDLGWLEPASEGLIFRDGSDVFADVADICAHVTQPGKCRGHFNPAGYARMAAFIGETIEALR